MSRKDEQKEHVADGGHLSAEVLALTLRQVRHTYRDYNQSLFSGRLVAPQLEWTESEGEWGAWVAAHRTIRLSVRLLSQGWGTLAEVLKHEMAHQYLEEVLGAPRGERPHGPTFRNICAERGIDARASGSPLDASHTPEPAMHKTLTRILHLLALAQSDNQHEAENAMATARRLMLKYNLDEALAGSANTYCYRHLGEPTGRRMAWQRMLGHVLSEYFFVEAIIVPVYRPRENKRGTVLEVCGTPANLGIAEYAHDFLERTALALWRRHKKENALRLDGDKQSFLYGVMSGFAEKLERESGKNQEEGLVWLGDPNLGRYFRARHPHVRSVSGSGNVAKDAFSAGHAAGGSIVLHRGVEAGSTRGGSRLLGSGKSS